MPKPDYKGAMQDLLEILATEPEPTNDTSKSSESTKAIQDVTLKSSETAYQFTDRDLTVVSSPRKQDQPTNSKK